MKFLKKYQVGGENEVQNEDEKAYLNFILNLYQMCRDFDEVSAIQNDYINLVADADSRASNLIIFKMRVNGNSFISTVLLDIHNLPIILKTEKKQRFILRKELLFSLSSVNFRKKFITSLSSTFQKTKLLNQSMKDT